MSTKVASLFTGVAGFEIGLPLDCELVLLCDNDLDAQSVLDHWYPDVPLVPDVSALRPDHFYGVDLVLAGFPCQDVSIVGGQRGLDGKKTPLVKHIFRLVQETYPDRVLLENVQSIRFVHRGRALSYLVSECERLGYAWAYRILDSRGFDLPQRRRRLYFLASRVDDPGTTLFGDPGRPIPRFEPTFDKPLGFYWTEGRTGHGLTGDAIPPLKAGSAIGIPSPPATLLPTGEVVVPTLETAERIQGFAPKWTIAAPTRSRWRLIGNAVSPPVPGWILSQPFLDSWSSSGCETLRNSSGWPLAAWGDGKGRRLRVKVYEAPSNARIGKLSTKSFEWVSISRRALTGFLSRATNSKLRYPAGFLDRLRTALTEIE